jgi:hypothetical protein
MSGVELAAILPGEPAELRRLREELDLRVPLLADPAWKAHDAYGFRRGSLADAWLSPETWAAYARLVRRGARPRRPRQDPRRLGGDVVVDPQGRVAWTYRSRSPADRPSIDEVLRQLRLAAHLTE